MLAQTKKHTGAAGTGHDFMDKETMNLVIIFIALIAFLAVVIFVVMGVGMAKEGFSGENIISKMWDSIWDFIFKMPEAGRDVVETSLV